MNRGLSLYIFLLIILNFIIQLPAAPARNMDAAEIELAIKKLQVLGSALYIAAHPDDENTALLAYLSKGKLVRTGYLSLTRGSGGQNLIGPEQGEMLGVLRTQELLAARKIDGAEQFFTRALDFGYSKSPEESIQIWGRDKILWDMVWIIRNFRPDIIITRFTPDVGGHGHHRASAILALEAFKDAGDPQKFPDQLKYVDTWQPKRVLWNTWHPALKQMNIDTASTPFVDIGSFNRLLGKSYGEIAAQSRSMHKSQGFGAASRRGEYREYFQLLAGDPAHKDIFDGIDLGWSRIPGGKEINLEIQQILDNYDPENPAGSLPVLLKLYREFEKLDSNYWIRQKKMELLNIIQSCAGLWLEASATEYFTPPGGILSLKISALNRSDLPLKLDKVSFSVNDGDTILSARLPDNRIFSFSTSLKIPANEDFSIPYWLRGNQYYDSLKNTHPEIIGLAQNPPALTAKFYLQNQDQTLVYDVPVTYKWTDPVEGEKYRRVLITPPATVHFDELVYVFPNNNPKEIKVQVKDLTGPISGTVSLSVPDDWQVTPVSQAFELKEKESLTNVIFAVTPPKNLNESPISANISIRGISYNYDMEEINYSHIPVQTVLQRAQSKLVRADLATADKHIGYIMGPGDDIPPLLTQAGYQVTLLNELDINATNLSRFDAVITGIRAYNTDDWLKYKNKTLLNYVYNGGTLLMQYNVTRDLVMDNLGPYNFEISHDRVTVEDAPVTFLLPDNPVLNYPEKITEADFNGWVQERGLYFADKWDPKYETPLACNDPGEKPKPGGLLIAKYGNGTFIYTGYSFFRQLPAGVPGAFRLFINLISAGDNHASR